VHVGVEETVAEDLREEDRDAVAGQLADVDAGRAQAARRSRGIPSTRAITITSRLQKSQYTSGTTSRRSSAKCA
jgi:hypothetical protein